MDKFLKVSVVLFFLAGAAVGPASGEEGEPPLIEKIEALTGLQVTQNQREAIADVSMKMLRALRARQRAFVAALKGRGTIPTLAEEALTPVDGLPFDFDQDALAVIAEHAAEPPDQLERDTIRYLDAQRGVDVERIRHEHAQALSGITDLPALMITDILYAPEEEEGTQEGAVRYP